MKGLKPAELATYAIFALAVAAVLLALMAACIWLLAQISALVGGLVA